MFKKLGLLILLFASCSQVYAQEYVQQIAKRACECAEKVKPTANEKMRNMEIGFCILNSADEEDRKKIKKDFNLDFNEIDKNGEKIGALIGMRMAPICPGTIMALSGASEDKSKVAPVSTMIGGEVTKVEKDFFVSFTIRDNTGKSNKLFWISPVETSIDLVSQYMNLQGKSFQFHFENQEIFDPKIGEYRPFKVIKKIIVK
jgi:hypothetical protein